MPNGLKALFGDITPEEYARIEAERLAREEMIAQFQKRPIQDAEKEEE